jgi:hypothetical protein
MKRMVSSITALAAAAAVLWLAPRGEAALAGDQVKQVEALIRQFAAKEFDTRQRAVEKLVELGPDVVPLVKAALASTTDKEVKLRCEMVLKKIVERYGVRVSDIKAAVDAEKRAFEPSRVTLQVKDVSLADVLDKLAEESGNAPLREPDKWNDKRLTLDIKDALYWEALGTICRAAGLTYVPGQQRPEESVRVLLERGADPGPLTCCVGPVAVRVTDGSRRRAFDDPEAGLAVTYGLTSFCEDHVSLLSSSGRVTGATTPDGSALHIVQAGVVDANANLEAVRAEPPALPADRMTVTIDKVPAGIDRIGELRATVRLEMAFGTRQLRVDDVMSGRKTVSGDGLTLALWPREKDQPGVGTWNLSLTRDGKRERVYASPGGAPYGVFIVDPDGKRYRGGVILNLAAGQPGAGGDGAPGRPADYLLQFAELPKLPGNWSLVYVYPEKVVTKEYDVKLKDVPLP